MKTWFILLLFCIPGLALSQDEDSETEEEPITWVDDSHAYATNKTQELTQWMDDFFGATVNDLEQAEILTQGQATLLRRIYGRELFSVHWELRVLLYAGILLLTTGLGLLIRKHFASVGHLALLAAIALIPDGLFVGKITSYKAGHRLDCELIKQLYLNQVLVPLEDF